MTDDDRYVPLSERINQDVWHDNFVPKYSAIATAQPNKLFLWGVWLIFAPWALWGCIGVVGGITGATQPNATAKDVTVLTIAFSLVSFLLAITILVTQTRRYFRAKAGAGDPASDDEEDDEASFIQSTTDR